MSAIDGGGSGTPPMTQTHSTSTATTSSTTAAEEKSAPQTPAATLTSAFSGDASINPALVHMLLAHYGSNMEAMNSQNRLNAQDTYKPKEYVPPSEDDASSTTTSGSAPSGGGSTSSSTSTSEPESWPLTSSFSMPGEARGATSSGFTPPADVEGFLEMIGAGEAATSLELMSAGKDLPPDQQLLVRLALNYQSQMAGEGKLFDANNVSQEEYNSLLMVYEAVHSAPEKRLAGTQEDDPNNFGFMLNLMDMMGGDEHALYENFNTGVAGGDQFGTQMSSFETLAAAGEAGTDDSVITIEDLAVIANSSAYTAADQAFAKRLLESPELMAKLARYDTGGVQVIEKAGLQAMVNNYAAELVDKESGMFKAQALIDYANSPTDIMDRTFLTWQVDEANQEITLDNGWKIKVYNERSSWDLIDPEGNVAHVWGDPHIDLKAGGEADGNTRDFDIAHDWTFMAGGAKISVGTVGNNRWKYSDTLTITSEGGQSIQVKGIHSGNVEFVTQNNGELVGTNGAAVDAQQTDGEWVVSGGTAMDWYHDINRDGSLSADEKENRQMNKDKYDEKNGFWDKNRTIT